MKKSGLPMYIFFDKGTKRFRFMLHYKQDKSKQMSFFKKPRVWTVKTHKDLKWITLFRDMWLEKNDPLRWETLKWLEYNEWRALCPDYR